MSFIILGFLTGMSLILAIGAQNIFVIEQGLKKNFVFLVCSICALSDFILIFLGIFLFQYFEFFFNTTVELIFNILLLGFLLSFIWNKIKENNNKVLLKIRKTKTTLLQTLLKTIGFTYLNPHVYSDTVFFLGNFSKGFLIEQKYYFGIGASVASIFFFFLLGYLSQYFSRYLQNKKVWRIINSIIILFMSFLTLLVLAEILY
ncbi:LysE family transporter [Candidatus Pelagibacter sp.]|jgi:L-lysine exporter family protein LysE/ArgO|nr:LysE family transporter [Candidatus Pelagibacter sp.]|tara:strand:- start:214 stop:822 length:609 start_codon:yes stop_codon:yes gene_type:complete